MQMQVKERKRESKMLASLTKREIRTRFVCSCDSIFT